jgi:hypothetical protein
VRVFIDHHTFSGDWKLRGNIFKFNSHFDASRASKSTVQTCEQPQPSIVPAGYVEVSFQKISEELSASRLSNLKTQLSLSQPTEESELFERRMKK